MTLLPSNARMSGMLNHRLSTSVVYIPLLFFVISFWAVQAEENDVVSLGSAAWKLAPQAEVTQTGEQITTAGFTTDSWLTAQVPGTVFGSYVLAGKEKDPNYGDHISHVDVSNTTAIFGTAPILGFLKIIQANGFG